MANDEGPVILGPIHTQAVVTDLNRARHEIQRLRAVLSFVQEQVDCLGPLSDPDVVTRDYIRNYINEVLADP